VVAYCYCNAGDCYYAHDIEPVVEEEAFQVAKQSRKCLLAWSHGSERVKSGGGLEIERVRFVIRVHPGNIL